MKYTDEDIIAFNTHLEQEPLTAIAVSMIINRPIEEVACTDVEQLKQTISECKDVALLTGFDKSIDDQQLSMIYSHHVMTIIGLFEQMVKDGIIDSNEVVERFGFSGVYFHNIEFQRYVAEFVFDQLIYDLDAWCYFNLGEEECHQVDL